MVGTRVTTKRSSDQFGGVPAATHVTAREKLTSIPSNWVSR